MVGVVICSNEYLQRLKPYLSEFFNGEKYIICSELDIQYNAGKWKDKNILKLCSRKNVNKILFAVNNKLLQDISHKLRSVSELGINTYYIPQYSYQAITSAEKLKDSALQIDVNKPRLKYLEFHVADHCNLNCKGCTHFCNLESSPKFTDFLRWSQDIHRLRDLLGGIDVIRIMGGEPLLNPELPKYVRKTRLLFPDSDVRIVTNGLLIPKISEELVLSMNETHTGFDISYYIPTGKLLPSICNKLDAAGVDYALTQPITQFYKFMILNPITNERDAYNNCSSKRCYNLKDGEIFTCPTICRISMLNKEYNQQFPVSPGINLSDVKDGWELYNKLNTPVRLCRYCCPPYRDWFEWEQKRGNNAEMSDWLVDEKRLPFLRDEWIKKQRIPRIYLNNILDKHELFGNLIRHGYFKLLRK